MRKSVGFVFFLLLIIAFSGCKVQNNFEGQTVDDELPAWAEDTELRYSISFAVPDGSLLPADGMGDGTIVYEAEDESYTIVANTTWGQSPQQIMTAMTGYSVEQLQPIKTQRYGMDEYRFSWCSTGEEGTLVCTGALLADENYCYSLQFRVKESAAKETAACREQVMSSFSLNYDEGY